MAHGATSFVPFVRQGAVLRAARACRNGTHMRVHGKNESYARRTLAKLTRLECGTRAGWQCKFIQNSKEPSARSTSPTYCTRPSDSSLSLPRSPLFPAVFALPGRRRPRLPGRPVHHEKRPIIRQKIRSVSIVKISLPKTRDSEPRGSNENARRYGAANSRCEISKGGRKCTRKCKAH